jgi:Zn-dependent protease
VENLSLGVLWYIIFLFSTVLHEAAHAFAALRMGDQTAYLGGQVSLNPIPHIKREPVGLLAVPIASFLLSGWMFGWASAPYDYDWAVRHPKRSALMAMAGPAANLALVAVSAVVIHLGYRAGLFIAPETIDFSNLTEAATGGAMAVLATALSVCASLNLILFLFNMLPLPGFDGSSLPSLFVSRESALKIMDIMRSRYSFGFLIVAWYLFDFIYDPVHLALISLLYPEFTYE